MAKEERKEYMKQYYLDHKEKWLVNNENRRVTSRRRYYERRKQNPSIFLYKSAKKRSKQYNLPFDISAQDIRVPDKCPVFGYELGKGSGYIDRRFSPSLDKIIPERGYVKGNIQVLSYLANAMKSDATPKELLMFANWIYKTYGGSNCFPKL